MSGSLKKSLGFRLYAVSYKQNQPQKKQPIYGCFFYYTTSRFYAD
jgi:hypothetical protein